MTLPDLCHPAPGIRLLRIISWASSEHKFRRCSQDSFRMLGSKLTRLNLHPRHLFSSTIVKMSTYKGATPSNPQVDPRVVEFYENFYRVSDDPSDQAHIEYVDSLTKDGTLVMGTKKATGYDNLMDLRKGLWSGPIKTRKHTLKQIFPFGDNSKNVMLHGSVDYGLKNGKAVTVEWAGRAELVEEGGKLKMKVYQVYLDSAPVANAAKD